MVVVSYGPVKQRRGEIEGMQQEIWRIKFRTSPDEYVFVHAVPVMTDGAVPPLFSPALCGRELPEHMAENWQAFMLYINQELVNCIECARTVGIIHSTGPRPTAAAR